MDPRIGHEAPDLGSTRDLGSGSRFGLTLDTLRRVRAKTGTFLGAPYDLRKPTVARFKSRWWNPDDPRLFTPRFFGWGWDVNLARIFARQR